MAIYVDQMFNTDGESTSLAELNADVSATTGKYSPLKDGKLLKIIIFIHGTAATSLVEGVRIELTNTNWSPNTLKFGATGNGLRTAPATPQRAYEYVVDQPVTEKSPIAGQYILPTGTPVTNNLAIFGVFQA